MLGTFGNVCLFDVGSHILTAVVTARVSANNRNHNANHSTEVEWDASGWMTDLNAPRSDCSCTDTVSCNVRAFHPFYSFLSMLGSHRHHQESTRRTLQSLAIAGKENAKQREERKR